MKLIEAAMKHIGIKPEVGLLERMKTMAQFILNPFAEDHESIGEHIGDPLARRLLATLPKDASLSVFKEKCKGMLRSKNEKVNEFANCYFRARTYYGLYT
ncbi:unnamed protein product, partial [Strongylus vulgaris]